jgi:hypothetical protein
LDENETERRVSRALKAAEKKYKWNWPSASFHVHPIRIYENMALQVAESRSVNQQSRANSFTEIFPSICACKNELHSLWSTLQCTAKIFWKHKQILINSNL